MKNIPDVVLLLALPPVGLWLMRLAFRDMSEFRASRLWPTVAGEVVRHNRNTGYGSAYTIWVHYQYEVDRQIHRGAFFHVFGRLDGGERQDFQESWGIGKRVVVYYNPASPQQSLDERDQGVNWFVFFVALVTLAAGVLTWWQFITTHILHQFFVR